MRNADNLLPSCAVVTKSGSLKFLEHSGPVQACNGTALPLPLPVATWNVIIAHHIGVIKGHGNASTEVSVRRIVFI